MRVSLDITGREGEAEIALEDVADALRTIEKLDIETITRITVGDKHTIHAILS